MHTLFLVSSAQPTVWVCRSHLAFRCQVLGVLPRQFMLTCNLLHPGTFWGALQQYTVWWTCFSIGSSYSPGADVPVCHLAVHDTQEIEGRPVVSLCMLLRTQVIHLWKKYKYKSINTEVWLCSRWNIICAVHRVTVSLLDNTCLKKLKN